MTQHVGSGPTQREGQVQSRYAGRHQSPTDLVGVKMGKEELISVVSAVSDIGAVDECLDFFQENWNSINGKLAISPLTFQKAVQRCRGTLELALHENSKHCNAESWKYFTLMSIFSSLTGMLSLLAIYIYVKLREKIKRKKSLEKETKVLRQQGTSAWAAAATIGVGRQRMNYNQQDPANFGKPKKEKRKMWKREENVESASNPSAPTWKPGMPGYPYPGYGGFNTVIEEGDETEAE